MQNRWFFLISQGGSGDQGPAVSALGIDKAARITFHALTNYLTSGANFLASREATIQAATNLYGQCSVEVDAVTKAWFGVGVGAPALVVCAGPITGQASFCTENGPYVSNTYQVSTTPGAVMSWRNSNGAFLFNGLNQNLNYVTLVEVPEYATQTTLSVTVTYNGASTTRSRSISTRECQIKPTACPPGEICPQLQAADIKGSASNRVAGQDYDVYPNPADGQLTIMLPASKQAIAVTIADMAGRRLMTQQFAVGQRKAELKVAGLPPGTFVLTLTGGQRPITQRIQIAR